MRQPIPYDFWYGMTLQLGRGEYDLSQRRVHAFDEPRKYNARSAKESIALDYLKGAVLKARPTVSQWSLSGGKAVAAVAKNNLVAVLTDGHKTIQATIFEELIPKCREGKTYILDKYAIYRPDTGACFLNLSAKTLFMMTAPMDVPDSLVSEAKALLWPSAQTVAPGMEVLEVYVTMTGTIKEILKTRLVKVRGRDVPLTLIKITDIEKQDEVEICVLGVSVGPTKSTSRTENKCSRWMSESGRRRASPLQFLRS
ncbi:hypothetical protein WMY93_033717 [Mugilogobius chulae]|uniref:Uncharacterized protein n=1 Tax=Mugilogobius chulae TaxID=88201 RepID=A0AAW0MJW0_9GOBI